MKNYDEINDFFTETLLNMDIILNNTFYKNKGNLKEARIKTQNWFDSFKNNKSLKGIDPKDLEFIGFEIYDLMDEYIATESVKENYLERLDYDFGHLKRYWKDEMLGGKINGKS